MIFQTFLGDFKSDDIFSTKADARGKVKVIKHFTKKKKTEQPEKNNDIVALETVLDCTFLKGFNVHFNVPP